MIVLTRRAFLGAALAGGAGLVLAACGENSGGSMGGMNHGGNPGAMGTGTMSGEYDQMFIDMMVTHHQAAVEMAKVAQRKAEHPEIKQLADAIVAEQEREIGQMKAWRKAWYGSDQIPTGTSGQMGGMGGMNVDLKQLENAQPFDKAFIDAMVPHHESAIAMAKEAQSRAKRQEIKDLAGQIIAAQEKEIAQMKAWRAQWYPG